MKRRCITLSILLTVNLLQAQQFPIKQYSVNDGLVQSQVTTIYQAKDGRLWIGTKQGVSVFDGIKFENFGLQDGLPSEYIVNFVEDDKDNMWIATRQGMVKYDDNTFEVFTDCNISFQDQSVVIDTSNRIWFLSKNGKDACGNPTEFGQLFKFENGKYTNINKQFPALKKMKVRSVSHDEKTDRLYLVVYGVIDGQYTESLYYIENHVLHKFQHISVVNFLQKDNSGNVYFLSENTICKIHEDTFTVVEKVLFKERYKIYFDQNNDLFISHNNAIYKLNKNGDLVNYNLKLNILGNLWFDQQNTLWVATEHGLVHVISNAYQYYEIGNVWSIGEDDFGNILLGIYNKGLFEICPFCNQAQNISDEIASLGISYSFYFGSVKDTMGGLLFPNHQDLLKYTSNSCSILNKHTKDEQSILSIYQDTIKHQLLLGKLGLQIIDYEGNEIAFYDDKDGLEVLSYTICITKDKYGNYWMGKHHGLSKYDIAKDTFINYSQKHGNFPAIGTFSLLNEQNERLWVGTRDGLFLYDEQKDTFLGIGTAIYNHKINFITEIDKQYLLLGTLTGVMLFDKKEYLNTKKVIFRPYNYQNGFISGETTINTFLKDSRGNIWVSGTDHLLKINPKKLVELPKPLAPKITLKYLNTTNNTQWEQATSNQLKYYQNTLRFDLQTVAFAQPAPIRYQYKLYKKAISKNINKALPIDETWSNYQEENYIVFSNLVPADAYTLIVIPYNAEGVAGEQQLFQFEIIPAWWQTLLAKVIFVFIGFGLITSSFLYFKNRKARLQQKAEQGRLEEQRKVQTIEQLRLEQQRKEQELKRLQQEVQKWNIEALQSQMDPHFIANVLTNIQSLIQQSKREQAQAYINDFAWVIRKFLEATKQKEISLKEEINLLQLYIRLEQLRFKDKFSYKITTSTHLNQDITLPPMLIQPLVENAINHGIKYLEGKGYIAVQFKQHDNTLTCEVTDNGVGRTKAKVIQLKTLISKKSISTDILKNRLSLLKANEGFDIDMVVSDLYPNEENTGTKVLLTFNLD